MDKDIEEVVAKNIQLIQLVIDCKGEIYNGATFKEFLNRKVIGQIFDGHIILNTAFVVKDKWRVEDIAVDDNDNKCDPN